MDWEVIRDCGSILSLFMTWPLLVAAGYVLYIWGYASATVIPKKQKTQVEWLIIGISIGFVSTILDNVYWTIAWSADFIDHPEAQQIVLNGVIANIFFRQLLGIMAAVCHIHKSLKDKKLWHIHHWCWFLMLSVLLGVSHIVTLFWMRSL